MTDTEILDYLQESITYRRRTKGPQDVELGSVVITVGLRPKNLRELLVEAIQVDLGLREKKAISEVAAELMQSPAAARVGGQMAVGNPYAPKPKRK